VEIAVEEKHLRRDTDPQQFAFELFAIAYAAHHDRRLLKDPAAVARATTAFEALIDRYAILAPERAASASSDAKPQSDLFSSQRHP
jgi:Tetracyclin repressor-like, C-terminal domain